MAEKTGIAWTDSTFNPWIGCTKVGPGCDNCYAEALMDRRWHRVQWGPHGTRQRTSAANWRQPLQWEREHEEFARTHGRRRRVFCASLADVFDNEAPVSWRVDLFALIQATPHLDWLLLTKRIGNVRKLLAEAQHAAYGLCKYDLAGFMGSMVNGDRPPPNVWLGITVVDQAEADRDIPKLLAVPARVRFLSIEPMLGPIDLTCIPVGGGHGHHEFDPITTVNVLKRASSDAPHVHWVICGGESGASARPMHPAWARSLRDQCADAGVPFFFKQWGGPSATAGGSALDGAEVKEWPCAA